MKQKQYTLIKIPLAKLIEQQYDVLLDEKAEVENGYLVTQGDSLLFDQIKRLRGTYARHIRELILVVAKKNPKQEPHLRHILKEGFTYNGIHYSRFGKSASQGKDGITAFVCDSMFDELYQITKMDIAIDTCVISKYEAQRCLTFSSCTLIENYMPNIVIIGEYEKTLPQQFIKYVVEQEKEFEDKETGETKTYTAREVHEGYRDIRLSPFDGCGCHEQGFTKQISAALELDYDAVGAQIRLPFIKGYSVYVPFRQILKEMGCEYITDIYGERHPVDTIDCIWNTTMFKGHKLFYEKYGGNAWHAYMDTIKKYEFKLGVSKYSHHTKHLNRYTRMNFQYLQCLDLWNPGYIAHYEGGGDSVYDILDPANAGKIIKLADYTTALFEKIIKGDTFYSYKFLGISETADDMPESKYLEAVKIHPAMLKDPAIKQFIYRRLKKAIDEAKTGKIYCSGFYHTGVGDMLGYLQYAAGTEPAGCLGAGELYSENFETGDIVSFRSPLVDPSEVNRAKTVQNSLTEKWFGHFKNQDIVMFNMYDISLPQQGGADCDGDIFFLCDEPIVIDAKIDKPVIIDIADKTTATPLPYTEENIIAYEIMTRDNRIGEITNAATSIENRYTKSANMRTVYDDYSSILRVMQGHEIDFIKTGTRWQMNKGLRKYLTQLPYFLLFHYPQKMKAYQSVCEKNRGIENPADKVKPNAYHSPSPMNELCDYICTWERKHILWDAPISGLMDSRRLIVDTSLDLSDKKVLRICRRYINDYAAKIKEYVNLSFGEKGIRQHDACREALTEDFKKSLSETLCLDESMIANYVIYASYKSLSVSKAFAWAAYGDVILKNLQSHTDGQAALSIQETPYVTDSCYEYLGKYYELEERDCNLHM